MTKSTNKLFKVTVRGLKGSFDTSYVVATDPTSAYERVRKLFTSKNYGAHTERELQTVELLAEEEWYPHADKLLLVDDRLATDKGNDNQERKDESCQNCECEAWRTVAAESNRAVDAYLRELHPDLPEHYGMPLDGVKQTIRNISGVGKILLSQLIATWETLHVKDTGELGFCDLDKALQLAGVTIMNDCSKQLESPKEDELVDLDVRMRVSADIAEQIKSGKLNGLSVSGQTVRKEPC